jgi:nucleotide-binding universal stress UspA family protein
MAPSRVRIERILCPTDFSDFSVRALTRAVSLARWFEARVTALHVLPRPVAFPAGAPPYLTVPADLTHGSREQEEKELVRWIDPFLGEGAPLETRLAEGDPSREIQAAAEALPADLVIMGTHGRSGFQHLLLGSVTEQVLRRASCPVLAVGAKVTASSPGGPLFHRILCPVDLSAASQATLDLALALAEENLARVTLLHVVESLLGEVGPEGYRPVPKLPPMENTLVDQAREQLHEAGRGADGFCNVSERVETGKAWQAILRVAHEANADLIVMGAHAQGGLGRLFFGSTANQVVRQAPCPVLVVREAKPRRQSNLDAMAAVSTVAAKGASQRDSG